MSTILLVGRARTAPPAQGLMLNLTPADSSTQIVEAIWPTSSAVCYSELSRKDVLPLRMFIQETLRRSRTSYSTLQVALYYLVLIKPRIPSRDFTMEQIDDRPCSQALQCGRRMFLSALILASKYLQDRNYSARAWSKISGLNTQEINQNEMAFLQAVNWRLHIADDVFRRWTDIVLKHTPPSMPPSPGGAPQLAASPHHEKWRHIILGLNTELTNVEELLCTSPAGGQAAVVDLPPWPRSLRGMSAEARLSQDACDANPIAKSCATPMVMEPTPTSVYTPGRWAPAMSLLPTPRLTPQASGFCTPAVGATPRAAGNGSAMSLAMSQASSVTSAQYLDRPPTSCSMPSPQVYCPVRRSSLATVSTASSPESMISDTSRTSRSSSISTASSLASATAHPKLSAPSRFRAAKLGTERLSSRPTIPSVPEDHEHDFTTSPDVYTGPVGRPGEWSTDGSLAGRKRSVDDMTSDATSDAARTLQELHSYGGYADVAAVARAPSGPAKLAHGQSLQANVRDLLRGGQGRTPWPNTLVRSRSWVSESNLQSHRPELPERKRVCCATEAANGGFEPDSTQPGLGLRGPGMWQGILN